MKTKDIITILILTITIITFTGLIIDLAVKIAERPNAVKYEPAKLRIEF